MRPELCTDCSVSCHSRCCCICHARQAAYDAGVADAEARIDAAIAKHAHWLRSQMIDALRSMTQPTLGERVLRAIIDPETKP